jgi:hypothetical protein
MSKLLLEFVKSGIESFPDATYGEGYRCSAYLNDGTYLPCVMLRKSSPTATLALRRFEQEKKGKGMFSSDDGYEKIVQHFVTSGNRVNHYDIARVEPSRYAIPLTLLRKIEGETTMAWTGFVLEMRDGKLLPFGTTFLAEFFDIPEAYSFADVVAVHNHSYVSPTGELRALTQGMSAQPADYEPARVNRERPYFVCFYDA